VFVPIADGISVSVLQEDDGLTYGANSGARVRTSIEVSRAGNSLLVAGSTDGHGFPEFARKRFRIILVGADIAEGNEVVLVNSGNDFSLSFQIL
jgi:alpha-glucosidase